MEDGAVYEYAEAIKAFQAQLLVLMHMSGGQPARGTELVTVQYSNGVDGDVRGLFIDDGAVVFVTMCNKTMGMSAKAKVIHRYLPRGRRVGGVLHMVSDPVLAVGGTGGEPGQGGLGQPVHQHEPVSDKAQPKTALNVL